MVHAEAELYGGNNGAPRKVAVVPRRGWAPWSMGPDKGDGINTSY